MAVNEMHGVLLTTVTFFSFALPVILISAVDAKASSDGSDFIQQCLPTVREKCQVKRHPNGSMVQTVPKRFHLPPAIAESLKRKMKTETPVQHLMCRFPDAACGSISQAFNGSCYIFSTSEVNHSSAVSACSENGSHLVYIGSQEEQDFILGNIGDSSDLYWIGLTRVPATWLDGSNLTYDRTVSNSFSDGGECFQIQSDGSWYDYGCSSEYRYICEKESGAACESTWHAFGGSCYILSTSEVNRSSAVSACSQNGSHLVYIGSHEEQDFIMGSIGDFSQNYWIGLTRVPATWLDGSSLTYDNTLSNSFDDGEECFITHYSSWSNWQGDWHDEGCSNEYRYICEKEIGD